MTTWGQQSVAEYDDLIKATDLEIDKIEKARAELGHAPDDSWDQDWSTLKDRYASAKWKSKAERTGLTTAEFFVPNNLITMKMGYGWVVNALRQYGDTHDVDPSLTAPIQKGDLEDLFNRINAVKPIVYTADEKKFVAPTATDVDKETSQLLSGAGSTVSSTLTTVKYVAIGALALYALSQFTTLSKAFSKK